MRRKIILYILVLSMIIMCSGIFAFNFDINNIKYNKIDYVLNSTNSKYDLVDYISSNNKVDLNSNIIQDISLNNQSIEILVHDSNNNVNCKTCSINNSNLENELNDGECIENNCVVSGLNLFNKSDRSNFKNTIHDYFNKNFNILGQNNVFESNKTNSQRRVVYLGGIPLGIDVKTNGLIITQKQDVVNEKGIVSPCKDIDIKNGDILLSINGNKVFTQKDVVENLKGKKCVELEISRNNNIFKYKVYPAIDVVNGTEKLGLWLKDGIQGIGTLTYVDCQTQRYGALGHPIEENRTYRIGRIFDANIYGYIKGEKGKAGELNGDIIGDKVVGTIDKNNTFGIFGKYFGDVSSLKRIEIARQDEIMPGTAYIYTTIDGNKPKCYKIEIIKKVNQLKPHNKGMVIRIVDKELLSKTNGILQGMSGSPIVQNNKLIGAVTHVFVNDPTKGYGIYADFMIDN